MSERFVQVDHFFTVPLDHARPGDRQITLYAREVRADDAASRDLPWLLFLGGGPGFPAPRPLDASGWLARAVRDYRVLLLDQRGTGRSTPFDRRSLAALPSPADQAEYLTHFRADSIVRDAETIRRALLGDARWSVLGQSFGGMCAVTYLSFAPEGLAEAYITGGLPGLHADAEDAYRALTPRILDKNTEHYARYPEDAETARAVARHLAAHDVELPGGRPLTVECFQSLGNLLGGTGGSHKLHALLEDPFTGGTELSDGFLHGVAGTLAWTAAAPLYALVHEATYAQGPGATNWAAQRVRDEHPAFASDDPVLFTGEAVYPWMFEQDPNLRPFREAAHLLAGRPEWPVLYDPDRLRSNTVPVAAAIYHGDMYVERGLSIATAEAIGNLRPWVTRDHEHDGLRVSEGAVLDHLFAMPR
ncbi:alpha/beta fold hydrolase [Spirillospora sp. CA-294931]|uniref:alpha/beta fold hydrolase n=1 Tax=Spirillospora sp. CA-294931 TaxID=3240042 RepID=UPI003D8D708B